MGPFQKGEYTLDVVQISNNISMSLSDDLGITQSEIQSLRSAAKNGVPHPVVALAQPPPQVGINTEQAVKQIVEKDGKWLPTLKPRLIDQSDFTNASSALAEIRAYGALFETGMNAKSRPAVPGKDVARAASNFHPAEFGPVTEIWICQQLQKNSKWPLVPH